MTVPATRKRKGAPRKNKVIVEIGSDDADTGAIPQRIDALLKERQAIELRMAGATYQEIADSVGYGSDAAAYTAVQRAMARVVAEPVEEMRIVQRERLNAMLLAVWPKVQRGDTSSINTALSIIDRLNVQYGIAGPDEAAGSVHIDNAVVMIPATASSADFIKALQAARGVDPGTVETPVTVDAEVVSINEGATKPGKASRRKSDSQERTPDEADS